VAGITVSTANSATIQNNTIGSIDASGTSATTAGGFLGIQTQGGSGVVTTSNNTIGSSILQNIRIGYMTTTGVAGGPLSNAGILTSTTTSTAGNFIGISNSAMASLVVQSVARTQTGIAAGMNSNLRTIGSAIGTSVMAAIVTSSIGLGGFPTEAAYDTAFLTMAGLALVAALIAGVAPVILRRVGYVEPIVETSPVATSMADADAQAEALA